MAAPLRCSGSACVPRQFSTAPTYTGTASAEKNRRAGVPTHQKRSRSTQTHDFVERCAPAVASRRLSCAHIPPAVSHGCVVDVEWYALAHRRPCGCMERRKSSKTNRLLSSELPCMFSVHFEQKQLDFHRFWSIPRISNGSWKTDRQ